MIARMTSPTRADARDFFLRDYRRVSASDRWQHVSGACMRALGACPASVVIDGLYDALDAGMDAARLPDGVADYTLYARAHSGKPADEWTPWREWHAVHRPSALRRKE